MQRLGQARNIVGSEPSMEGRGQKRRRQDRDGEVCGGGDQDAEERKLMSG
jgi:hypothetical protein